MTSRRGLVILIPLVAVAVTGGVVFLYVRKSRNRCLELQRKVVELEALLETSLNHRAAERRGRIRAQQELRKALVQKCSSDAEGAIYPMTPIGIIQSCFSTRNGTPRQPLLVPIARACLVLMPGGVPGTSFDGLGDFSHCWLLYVFHANTDLPYLWKEPSHRDFKAKVRVPRLDGGKLGVYATRTPHRPCPIGLTVAKVEGVRGRMLLLSGIDLIDGTPVLDVKPYLPFCDSVQGSTAPPWVVADSIDDPIALLSVEFSKDFLRELSICWEVKGGQSMYSGPAEFQILVEQILFRDIRSLRQRHNPHDSSVSVIEENLDPAGDCLGFPDQSQAIENEDGVRVAQAVETCNADRQCYFGDLTRGVEKGGFVVSNGTPTNVVYHVTLEGINIAYTVNHGHVFVQGAEISVPESTSTTKECNYNVWAQVVGCKS